MRSESIGYIRRNPDPDDARRVTLSWPCRFQVSEVHFITEGFADCAGDADLSYHKNQIWIGVEYSYWRNKYGIQGITESNPRLKLNWNV